MNEFNEGQWWFKEIECALSEGTPDQRRAIAVIRNLLQTVNENKDKERMDFIEAHPNWLCKHKKHWCCVSPFTNYEFSVYETAREAIDGAIVIEHASSKNLQRT